MVKTVIWKKTIIDSTDSHDIVKTYYLLKEKKGNNAKL
jgi:hypothetical protein